MDETSEMLINISIFEVLLYQAAFSISLASAVKIEETGETEETKFSTRFFAVHFDSSGQILPASTEFVSSIAEETACEYARKAVKPIAESYEKQKQFITDANHELKTPLTLILTNLDIVEAEVGKNEWLEDIRAEGERMNALVRQLVTLTRMDEDGKHVAFERFSISEMANDTLSEFAALAAGKGLRLSADVQPHIEYCGDEAAIRRVVSILLDNAVKYTDSGGSILLRLEESKKSVVFSTSNPCTGLDTAELDRLFDRFYRPDRSRSKQTGGFGVGLSIAQSIVEAHHGSLRAECPEEGMIRFVAVLHE